MQELKKDVIQEIHYEEENDEQKSGSPHKISWKEENTHRQTDVKKLENLITVDYKTTREMTCL